MVANGGHHRAVEQKGAPPIPRWGEHRGGVIGSSTTGTSTRMEPPVLILARDSFMHPAPGTASSSAAASFMVDKD
uniref:Uncharacterized protein n=1 Tax=Anopheles albimanus TaxID=7167 RepID=A0A182FDC8_ANOAL